MKRDDIIRMAREAGLTVGTNISGVQLVGSPGDGAISLLHMTVDELERFAALVAAAEREECADIASNCCEGCADAIRARGEA